MTTLVPRLSRFLLSAVILWLLGAGSSFVVAEALQAQDDKKEPAPTLLQRFEFPRRQSIMGVAFAPETLKAAAVTLSGEVWIFDVGKIGKPQALEPKSLRKDMGFQSTLTAAFSPDGKRLLLGCDDGTVRLWDVESGTELLLLQGHKGPVWSVAFFKDGKRALSGSTSPDYSTRKWDLETGQELWNTRGKDRPDSISLSPDEKSFVTTEFKTVHIRECQSGSVVRSLEGHESRVHGTSFSPDGRNVTSVDGGGQIRVWEADTGKCVRNFGGTKFLVVGSVSFSAHGRRALLGCPGEVEAWDLESGTLTGRLDDLYGAVSVAFLADGRQFLAGERLNRFGLWELPPPAGKNK